MKQEYLQTVLAARREGRAVAVFTRLSDGEQHLWAESEATALSDAFADAARNALRRDRSGTVEIDQERWFVHQYNSPLRMIVVGAVHIAQALVPLAASTGYGVTVIDPRRAFASDARFPDVAVSTEWPDAAMDSLSPDRRTAVVTLTHDPKLDDPALHVALRSDAFYVGCLGSKRTHAARVSRLEEAGFKAAEIARIHGPVGLDIGASSPSEIAVSIMAQITRALRQQDDSS